jgi:predicted GNAT family acetyltransferase
MTAEIRDNAALQRFELPLADGVAFAQYRKADGVVTIYHTEVPAPLRGQGVAAALVAGALNLVRRDGLKLIPRCSYVTLFLKRHAEFRDLVV